MHKVNGNIKVTKYEKVLSLSMANLKGSYVWCILIVVGTSCISEKKKRKIET